jgi:branched-chain amino acid aminotransferase
LGFKLSVDYNRWRGEAIAYIRDQRRPEGEFVRDLDAMIDIWDLGYTYGWNAYDYTRTYDKKLWQGKEHTERVYRSLKYIGIDPQMSQEKNLRICEELVLRNKYLVGKYDELAIWQEFTPGAYGFDHARHMEPEMKRIPTVVVKASPIELANFVPLWKEGVRVITPSIRHVPPMCFDVKVKNYDRLNFALATTEVKMKDTEAFALLLDIWGNIAEGTGWSLFIVRDGKLYAPTDRNILPSVSRANVIKLANEHNISVVLQDLQPFHLYTADEAILATTPVGILPIARYNEAKVGKEIPGPITLSIAKAWSDWVGHDIIERANQAYGELTQEQKARVVGSLGP